MTFFENRVDKIISLYTVERLEKSKERYRCLDRGQTPPDRMPFRLSFPFFSEYDVNHPAKERLESYLNAFEFLSQFEDDTIPYVFPGLSHATEPSLFGAKEITCGIESTCEKMIFDIEDIDKLPEPEMKENTVASKWLETARYLFEQTNGKLPIHVCDMQGPFDVCAQLWSYDDMYIAALEDPDAYHKLMTKLTDAFILMWKSQKDILGKTFQGTHLFPYGWVGENCGVALSADSLVMVSASFYREFYKPYILKLYHELGDITIHSCGDFRHNIKELCQTQGIKAINAAQLSIQQLYEAGLDPKIQLLSALDFTHLEEDITFIKEHSLNVRPVIYGVYPMHQNPLEWSGDTITEIKKKTEYIQQLMRV